MTNQRSLSNKIKEDVVVLFFSFSVIYCRILGVILVELD